MFNGIQSAKLNPLSFTAIKGTGITLEDEAINIDLQPQTYTFRGCKREKPVEIYINGNPKEGMEINADRTKYSNSLGANNALVSWQMSVPGSDSIYPHKFKKIQISEVGPNDVIKLGSSTYINGNNRPHVDFEELKANKPFPEASEIGDIIINHGCSATFKNVIPNSKGEGLTIVSDIPRVNAYYKDGQRADNCLKTVYNGASKSIFKIKGSNLTIKAE